MQTLTNHKTLELLEKATQSLEIEKIGFNCTPSSNK